MFHKIDIWSVITWIVVGIFTVSLVSSDPLAHFDFFHHGDSNNDTSLSMVECSDFFMEFDVDQNDAISKGEFFLKWTFANQMDADHVPLFFRLIDNDFSGYISKDEIAKLCSFFDDDEDGKISEFEFDFTWKGLFRLTKVAA